MVRGSFLSVDVTSLHIFGSLIGHILSNALFCPTPHGLKRGFSRDTQLLQFIRDTAVLINSGTKVYRVFLDFRNSHAVVAKAISVYMTHL